MAFMHMHGGKDLWQHYNEDENKEELTSFQKMFDEISRTRFLPFFPCSLPSPISPASTAYVAHFFL
jgi:hypothetical protein